MHPYQNLYTSQRAPSFRGKVLNATFSTTKKVNWNPLKFHSLFFYIIYHFRCETAVGKEDASLIMMIIIIFIIMIIIVMIITIIVISRRDSGWQGGRHPDPSRSLQGAWGALLHWVGGSLLSILWEIITVVFIIIFCQ